MPKLIVLTVLACLFVGCATAPKGTGVPMNINVTVGFNGEMFASDFGELKQEDLPAFANESGDRPVHVVPQMVNVPFQQIVQARDALRKAGVKQVVIGEAAAK